MSPHHRPMPVVLRSTLVQMPEWDVRRRVPVDREGMIVRLRREARSGYARLILPGGTLRIPGEAAQGPTGQTRRMWKPPVRKR